MQHESRRPRCGRSSIDRIVRTEGRACRRARAGRSSGRGTPGPAPRSWGTKSEGRAQAPQLVGERERLSSFTGRLSNVARCRTLGKRRFRSRGAATSSCRRRSAPRRRGASPPADARGSTSREDRTRPPSVDRRPSWSVDCREADGSGATEARWLPSTRAPRLPSSARSRSKSSLRAAIRPSSAGASRLQEVRDPRMSINAACTFRLKPGPKRLLEARRRDRPVVVRVGRRRPRP